MVRKGRCNYSPGARVCIMASSRLVLFITIFLAVPTEQMAHSAQQACTRNGNGDFAAFAIAEARQFCARSPAILQGRRSPNLAVDARLRVSSPHIKSFMLLPGGHKFVPAAIPAPEARNMPSGSLTEQREKLNQLHFEREAWYDLMRRKLRASSYQDGFQDIRRLFSQFDIDKNGALNWTEYRTLLMRVGMRPFFVTDDDLRMLFYEMGASGKGIEIRARDFFRWFSGGYQHQRSADSASSEPHQVSKPTLLDTAQMSCSEVMPSVMHVLSPDQHAPPPYTYGESVWWDEGPETRVLRASLRASEMEALSAPERDTSKTLNKSVWWDEGPGTRVLKTPDESMTLPGWPSEASLAAATTLDAAAEAAPAMSAGRATSGPKDSAMSAGRVRGGGREAERQGGWEGWRGGREARWKEGLASLPLSTEEVSALSTADNAMDSLEALIAAVEPWTQTIPHERQRKLREVVYFLVNELGLPANKVQALALETPGVFGLDVDLEMRPRIDELRAIGVPVSKIVKLLDAAPDILDKDGWHRRQVLIHTTIYVSSILLHMCPHTARHRTTASS